MSRTPQERLADIQESAARAQRAVDAMERARASGDDDEELMAFDALLYRLVVIGEAVKALPPELLDREPEVPWREVARLRDLLAHHYYRVDTQIIRRTVDAPLQDLQVAARRLLDDVEATERREDEHLGRLAEKDPVEMERTGQQPDPGP